MFEWKSGREVNEKEVKLWDNRRLGDWDSQNQKWAQELTETVTP